MAWIIMVLLLVALAVLICGTAVEPEDTDEYWDGAMWIPDEEDE